MTRFSVLIMLSTSIPCPNISVKAENTDVTLKIILPQNRHIYEKPATVFLLQSNKTVTENLNKEVTTADRRLLMYFENGRAYVKNNNTDNHNRNKSVKF